MTVLWLVWLGVASASVLEEGTRALQQGDVDAALVLWDDVPAEERSGLLEYDLSLARYMQGDLARSLVHLRATLSHRPRDGDALHNLAFVRSELEAVPPPVGEVRAWMSMVTPNELGWGGVLLSLGGLFLWGRGRRTPSQGTSQAMAVGLWCVGLTLTSVALEGLWVRGEQPVAVVVDAETGPRDTPHVEAERLFMLGVGSEVRVVNWRADWCLIEDGRKRRGWVSTRSLMSVGLANTRVED
jgi:hypothetical protein